MKSQENIILAIQSLLRENQTPTVATIKSRLPTPLPLRDIIQGLQHWQRHPDSLSLHAAEPLQENVETLTLEARITALEQQVMALIQQVDALKNH